MATLKTNYKDDILDTSVNTQRKYRMVNNADGTISLEDVTVYTQNGDSFGAADINKTNQAVLDLNSSLTPVRGRATANNGGICDYIKSGNVVQLIFEGTVNNTAGEIAFIGLPTPKYENDYIIFACDTASNIIRYTLTKNGELKPQVSGNVEIRGTVTYICE